jgi:hypothetical protein
VDYNDYHYHSLYSTYEELNYLLDPHTAVAVGDARAGGWADARTGDWTGGWAHARTGVWLCEGCGPCCELCCEGCFILTECVKL